MAWKIVLHAFRMIFGNIVDALKVSVGPILIWLAIVAATFVVFRLPVAPLAGTAMGAPLDGGGFVIAFAIILVSSLAIFAWIAVAWHRFILLEQYPGMLPAWKDQPITPYVLKSITIFVLLVLGALLGGFVVIGLFSAIGGPALVTFGIMAISFMLSYFALRMGLVLPAAAVGEEMEISESLAQTKPMSSNIFGVAATMIFLNFVAGLVVTTIYSFASIIGVVLDIATTWLFIMANISVLTTLYGMLIEGRELAD